MRSRIYFIQPKILWKTHEYAQKKIGKSRELKSLTKSPTGVIRRIAHYTSMGYQCHTRPHVILFIFVTIRSSNREVCLDATTSPTRVTSPHSTRDATTSPTYATIGHSTRADTTKRCVVLSATEQRMSARKHYTALDFIFLQNFEISIERVELLDVDSEVVTVEGTLVKYNRTYKAYSLNYTVLKEFGYDLYVEVQVLALYSNEYRRTPINFKRNVCDIFKMEFLWFKNQILKYSHFPTECPLQTGDYYLKDFVPNGADFPVAANFPWENCMLFLRFVYKDKIIANLKMYLTFDHDAELKRLG
ncbi:hypothetical protein CBL_10038 [Carabus blaptoides fortunei]